MILLVDAGNTRIKWAQFNGGLTHSGSVAYKNTDLTHLLDTEWGAFMPPTAVYIANVGPEEIEHRLSGWIRQHWQCPIEFIRSSASAAGVTNGYTNPTQLGVDRWLAMIAAHHLIPGDVCVFDCGTAITMDFITVAGRYEGGLIFPGLTLLQASLIANTAGCSMAQQGEFINYNQIVAKNTQDGIQLGSLQAAVSIIEQQAARLLDRFKLKPTFVITGGDAEILLAHLSQQYQYFPQLVLQGLSLLIQNN
jgi:type III pantothenate kinase